MDLIWIIKFFFNYLIWFIHNATMNNWLPQCSLGQLQQIILSIRQRSLLLLLLHCTSYALLLWLFMYNNTYILYLSTIAPPPKLVLVPNRLINSAEYLYYYYWYALFMSSTIIHSFFNRKHSTLPIYFVKAMQEEISSQSRRRWSQHATLARWELPQTVLAVLLNGEWLKANKWMARPLEPKEESWSCRQKVRGWLEREGRDTSQLQKSFAHGRIEVRSEALHHIKLLSC